MYQKAPPVAQHEALEKTRKPLKNPEVLTEGHPCSCWVKTWSHWGHSRITIGDDSKHLGSAINLHCFVAQRSVVCLKLTAPCHVMKSASVCTAHRVPKGHCGGLTMGRATSRGHTKKWNWLFLQICLLDLRLRAGMGQLAPHYCLFSSSPGSWAIVGWAVLSVVSQPATPSCAVGVGYGWH